MADQLRGTFFAFASVFRLTDDALLFLRSGHRWIIGHHGEFAFALVEIFVILRLNNIPKRRDFLGIAHIALDVRQQTNALHLGIVGHDRWFRLRVMAERRRRRRRSFIRGDKGTKNAHVAVGHSIVTFDVLHVERHATNGTFETTFVPELEGRRRKNVLRSFAQSLDRSIGEAG